MTDQFKSNYRNKPQKGFLTLLLMAFALAVQAQTVSVSGKVADATGPLLGVSIIVKGTTTGTATDFDGNYTLDGVDSNATLVFSYVGYLTQEVAVAGRSVINITLQEDLAQLDEVVVVGYGTMERANVTGAISTVEMEEVAKAPVVNVVESLRGQVAGVQISRNTGQPGSPPVLKIRGNNSLGASTNGGTNLDTVNQPIIVVDGVPLVGGNMAEFNPDDIESINILKDAASASIYGSSGANGVVLITTKSGKKGKTQITVNSSSGFVSLAQRPDIMTGDEFVKFRIDVNQNSSSGAQYFPNTLGLDPIEYANYIEGNQVDWMDEVARTGVQNNVGLTVSGGTEKTTFYLNGDFFRESGPLVASDYKRFSVRFNGDLQATDWLKIGARVQLSKSFADQRTAIVGFGNGGVPALSALVESSPYGNLYDEDGNYSKFATTDLFAVNPLHKFNESELDVNITRSYVNPYVNIDIAEGLDYTLNTFAEDRREFLGRFQSTNFTDGADNLAQIRERQQVTYLIDNILSYKKDFGKHGFDVALIYGMQKSEWTEVNSQATRTAADELGYWGLGTAPQELQSTGVNTSDWAKSYLAGRLGYNYDGRYSATLTLRRDVSNKFIGDNRVGYFPSAAFAWNAHNEAWWFGGDTFSNFKVRLSYGELGNDNIPSFSYQANTNAVLIPPADAETGLIPGNVAGNPDIKWETSKQFNVGVDFGFFNSRVNGSVEVYNTKTTDVLLYQRIPAALNNGYEFYPSNIGETENSGVEVGLRGDIIRTEDFSWNMGVNWATSKSKIIRLNELGEDGEPLDDIDNGWFIGQDFQEIYGFEYLGVWQIGETPDVTNLGAVPQPGDPKIRDTNGDGNVDFEDRTFLGNPTPDWYGGINNVFRYKGLELSVLFEFVEGVKRINSIYNSYNSARQNRININYWTPDNPTNDYPRVGEGSAMTPGGTFYNSIFLEDASFVSLRNVSLSYSLPSEMLDRTFLNGLTLSVSGNNLKYWTDYTNAYSPEITNTDQYPISKTWVMGIKLTF
ncbi:SusC/RagA family TonB-linked outer membrane protein [Mangrovimonas xylaniphaga]|uniref:SusC/RagA family TonB-linked outer membrane protein n=1 Tax=Mangrovimonas xylaniphaga TaxID=1645915 RepID=UPI0006B49C35|nr:TonB-dependent receptor [Mangrovimonas xylaniphaga]